MTGFWDAVGRAVLGRGGTAAPKPRSLFEPDGAEVTFPEEPDLLIDAEPIGQEQVAAAARSITVPPEAPELPRAGTPDRPVGPPIDSGPGSPDASVPTPEPRVAPPERIIVTTVERPASPAASPVPVDRVEHHHLETTRVVVEPVPLLHLLAENSATARPPGEALEPAEPIGSDDLTAAPADPPSDERLPVVAAPPAVAVEPRTAPSSPEALPPLIVEIEHLDIRITSERVASPPPSARPVHAAVPSLGEYLARRSEGPR